MIIFLYGPDTYRSRHKLNRIISAYKSKNKRQLDLVFVDFKENPLSYRDFKSDFNSVSIFGEKKMFVLENAFKNIDFENSFLEDKKDYLLSKNILIFFERDKIKPGDRLVKFLVKKANSQKFNLLSNSYLRKWIEKKFHEHNLELDISAEILLINFVGNNLWRLSQEINKLSSFKNRGGRITKKDIMNLIHPRLETDIFKTIDSIALKDKKKALSLIHSHIQKGDNPFYLLSMISYQFRTILVVKDLWNKKKSYGDILRLLKMKPFVLRKFYYQSQKFSYDKLKKIYHKIFEVDFNIKTGRIEPEIAIDLLISEII